MRGEIKQRLQQRELELGREYLRKQEQLQAGSKFQGATTQERDGQCSATSGAHVVGGDEGSDDRRQATNSESNQAKTSRGQRTPAQEQIALQHTSITRGYSLSDSRRRILELSTQGLKPREIAAQIGIAVSAVYRHLEALRKQKKIKPLERVSGLAPLTTQQVLEQGDHELALLYPRIVKLLSKAIESDDLKTALQLKGWIDSVRDSLKQRSPQGVTINAPTAGAVLVNQELRLMDSRRNNNPEKVDEQIKLLQSPTPAKFEVVPAPEAEPSTYVAPEPAKQYSVFTPPKTAKQWQKGK